MPILLCHCSCPDADTARRLATVLVDERLAACAQVGAPVASVYRWQGQVETATEVPLQLKTTPQRWPALQQRLQALHPYELPELVAVEALATPAYAAWVAAETDPAPEAR